MNTNRTLPTEFVLLGFSNDQKTNKKLFVMFLAIYLVAILGNVLIIYIVLKSPRLHTQMYFFLCNLAILDLLLSTAAIPRLLFDLLSAHRIISMGACKAQFLLINFCGGTEAFLLALMAYDRFLAICHPLHYAIRMRWTLCHRLTVFVWMFAFFMFDIVPFTSQITLCYPNHINHFVCEALALTQLVCEGTRINNIMMIVVCFIALFLPFMCVIVSYICIISTILKLQTAKRSKAFSTCTSHLTVVVMVYGTSILMYFGPSTQYSRNQGKYLSMFSYIISPALNPIIYSLNNKEVMDMLKKCLTIAHL